jgi:hypothetical protein
MAKKPVAYFNNQEKGHVMCKGDGTALTEAFGPALTDVIGRTVDLVVRDVESAGKVKPAVRISIPKVKALRAAKPTQSAAPKADTGD